MTMNINQNASDESPRKPGLGRSPQSAKSDAKNQSGLVDLVSTQPNSEAVAGEKVQQEERNGREPESPQHVSPLSERRSRDRSPKTKTDSANGAPARTAPPADYSQASSPPKKRGHPRKNKSVS